MSLRFPDAWLAALMVLAAGSAACERETRRFREAPPAATADAGVRLSTLEPGPPTATDSAPGMYEDNAWAVSEGKRLFSQFNCVGCHAHGGGAIGPPLMDARWTYGAEPRNVYASIAEGRPNGMPAFGTKVGAQQIWQLAAYVRSMSGLLPKDVAPGRSDHMQVKAAEQSAPAAEPRDAAAEPPIP